MIFIGIDPGIKGGIGVINDKWRELDQVIDMPKETKFLYSYFTSWNFERGYDIFCVLEKAQPMPKQGVKGVFTYGIGYGKLLAILDILQIPFQEVPPAKWKKEFSLNKKDKKESVKVAQQLFPDNIKFYTEKGRILDGRAEALLLAEYARRIYHK